MRPPAQFSPVAIVGQGVVLPGAHTPDALWQALVDGRDLLTPAPSMIAARLEQAGELSGFTDRGGYVTGFQEAFDPSGFFLDAEEVMAADVQIQWLLHAARHAFHEAGYAVEDLPTQKVGAIVGNLGFPTRSLTRLAEYTWLQQQSPTLLQAMGWWPLERYFGPEPDPAHRFMSGLFLHRAAEALGIQSTAFGLDSACASSLYAIDIACQWLNQGRADMMLAGGINASDPLFFHKGFRILRAMSPSGQSRPFHQEADGIVPSEGAAVVVLKRLDDAMRENHPILGVIRGIGLSNDGAEGGRLTPAVKGEVSAMEEAFRVAGLRPQDLSLVECHATGAPVGDAKEIESLSQVFCECDPVPIGSLKSNLGHLVTASGAAGLIKVLLSMRHEIRVKTVHIDKPRHELEGAPVRLLTKNEPWPIQDLRRAGVSSFGFGGTNAHLLVEQWNRDYHGDMVHGRPWRGATELPKLAVVGLGVAGDLTLDRADERMAVSRVMPPSNDAEASVVNLPTDALRIPPHDLMACSGQQLMALRATYDAVNALPYRLPDRTGVYMGTESDAEVCRHVARIHFREWLDDIQGQSTVVLDPSWQRAAQDTWAPLMDPAEVMGVLPNMPANLLNRLFNWTGPGFTVSDDRASGTTALTVAMMGLAFGEIDAAVVGAVDAGAEPVHASAVRRRFPDASGRPADGAIVLVVERLEDAKAQNHPIIAILHEADEADEADVPVNPLVRTPPVPWHTTETLMRLLDAIMQSRWGSRGSEPLANGPSGSQPFLILNSETVVPWVENLQPAPSVTPAWIKAPVHRLPVIFPPLPSATPEGGAVWEMPLPPATLDPTKVKWVPPIRPLANSSSSVDPWQRAFYGAVKAHRNFLRHAAEQHQEFLKVLSYAPLGPFDPASRHRNDAYPSDDRAPTTPFASLTPNAGTDRMTSAAPRRGELDRPQLLMHAAGKISAVFGPLFASQDGYPRRARMPAPPLLLVDRVLALEGEAGRLGTGSVRTESDVKAHEWYIHDGYMAAGAMVESGQADLLLISWLGVDFKTEGHRVYRLLGCELTFHGPLCRPGETLTFDIEIERHVTYGDVHLFFFHNDGRVGDERRISVRHGEAGFFSADELEHASGVFYDPDAVPVPNGPLDPPAIRPESFGYRHDQLEAVAQGRPWDCFGAAFDGSKTHVRTPRLPRAPLLMLDEVVRLDIGGGPWGRGYLRAETSLSGDEWFFDGHFVNDPVMPGTLMFEGTLQALAFYLLSLGYALDKDGWRFQPAQERPFKMVCRGQVTPKSRKLAYEVFVRELIAGPIPTVVADVLVTVDGLKAFHCQSLALELVPDWPITSHPVVLEPEYDVRVLEASIGRLAHVFGERYRDYDIFKRAPRLPAPPFLFVSRIVATRVETGLVGSEIRTEWDIDPTAWYCQTPRQALTPGILAEVALQPCGWLASLLGIPLLIPEDVHIRNLDGALELLRDVPKERVTIRAQARLTKLDGVGGMALEHYQINLAIGDEAVARFTTVFGHFTDAALGTQTGIAREAGFLERPSPIREPLQDKNESFADRPSLQTMEEITGFWADLGRAGLGIIRAEKRVDRSDWCFRAHFYQDPVQPGSLGLEAIGQVMEWYLSHSNRLPATDSDSVRLAKTKPIQWRYRGQILPHHRTMTVEVEITSLEIGPHDIRLWADAWVWVDGRCIYEINQFGIEADIAADDRQRSLHLATQPGEQEFDPEANPWVFDHRPTLTKPALPLALLADLLAGEVLSQHPNAVLTQLERVQVFRWVVVDQPLRMTFTVEQMPDAPNVFDVTLYSWREAQDAALSRLEAVAQGRVTLAGAYPPPGPLTVEALNNPRMAGDPYRDKVLIHGPAFQVIRSLVVGSNGMSGRVAAEASSVPPERLSVVLIDGIAQMIGVPYLEGWRDDDSRDPVAAFPIEIVKATFYGPLPIHDSLQCEIRQRGRSLERSIGPYPFVEYEAFLSHGDTLWARLILRIRLFPTGPLGKLPGPARHGFLRKVGYIKGAGLSTVSGHDATVRDGDIRDSNWFPGTVNDVYEIEEGTPELMEIVAVKDWVANLAEVHPAFVQVDLAKARAAIPNLPLNPYRIVVSRADHVVTASGDPAPGPLDLEPIQRYIRDTSGQRGWLMEDIWRGFVDRFVGRVVLTDPPALEVMRSRPVLYLANHQTGVESMLFAIVMATLTHRGVAAVAKQEHRQSWIGRWMTWAAQYPGATVPQSLRFVDRSSQEAMLRTVHMMETVFSEEQASLLVHVEGTRSLVAHHRTQRMSGLWIDLAIKAGVSIVPVRLAAGLPVEPLSERLEFPWQFCKQDFYLGPVIEPESLGELVYKDRIQRVVDIINDLGMPPDLERPNPGNPELARQVSQWMEQYSIRQPEAVMAVLLRALADQGPDTRLLFPQAGTPVVLPANPRGRWLERAVQAFYGTDGVSVRWTQEGDG